jgi:hypothetical protein
MTLGPQTNSGGATLPGTASWTIGGGTVSAAPGTYHVTVTVTDPDTNSGSTAKVSSDSLTPTGVMQFSRGRHIIDIVEVDPNGSAKVPFKAPRHPRTYTLHAVYTDNAANFAGSQDEVELKVR